MRSVAVFRDHLKTILRWRIDRLDHCLVNSVGQGTAIFSRLPFPQEKTTNGIMASSGNSVSDVILR